MIVYGDIEIYSNIVKMIAQCEWLHSADDCAVQMIAQCGWLHSADDCTVRMIAQCDYGVDDCTVPVIAQWWLHSVDVASDTDKYADMPKMVSVLDSYISGCKVDETIDIP